MKFLYEVELGIDRAAQDTHKRIFMQVKESDPLSAAIEAEKLADKGLEDPAIMYTHAIHVSEVKRALPSVATMPLAMAA